MAARHKDASREALSRLPKLDIRELREEWCRLYKAGASPHLSQSPLLERARDTVAALKPSPDFTHLAA